MGKDKQGHVVWSRSANSFKRHHQLYRISLLLLFLFFELLLLTLLFLDVNSGCEGVLIASEVIISHAVRMLHTAIVCRARTIVGNTVFRWRYSWWIVFEARWHESLVSNLHFLEGIG